MDVKARARASDPTEDVLYDVIRHVRPLFRALAKSVEDQLEGTGITVAMRAVLERVLDDGPRTVPQIGRSLSIKRQFVQRVVNAALELGLLETAPNPAHARSSLVALTPAGEATIRGIRDREQAVLRGVAEGLTRADAEACLRVIAHLTSEFDRIAQPQEGDDGDGAP